MKNNKKQNEFVGTERELLAMSRDLDELHNDVGMPAMHAAVSRWTEEIRTSGHVFSLFLKG